MTKSDMIHRPNHYTWRGGMECVDINGIQDLDKAIECLKMLRNRETREASAAK